MRKIKLSVASAIVSIVSLIGFGTWAFRMFEDWTWAQSFYFTVSSLTTVGYGDEFVPTTDGSRVFTAIFILFGVGIVLAALTTIGSSYLKSQEKQISESIIRRIKHAELEAKQKIHTAHDNNDNRGNNNSL